FIGRRGGSTRVGDLLRTLLRLTRDQLKLLHCDPDYRRARQRAPAQPRDDPAASRDENAREPLVVITEIRRRRPAVDDLGCVVQTPQPAPLVEVERLLPRMGGDVRWKRGDEAAPDFITLLQWGPLA